MDHKIKVDSATDDDEEDSSFFSADEGDNEDQDSRASSIANEEDSAKSSENHYTKEKALASKECVVGKHELEFEEKNTGTKMQENRATESPKMEICNDGAADKPMHNSSWFGGGWNSLINAASGSINTLTSSVGEGFSTVLETVESSLGAPSPEQLVHMSIKEKCALKQKADELKEPLPVDEPDDCDSAEEICLETEECEGKQHQQEDARSGIFGNVSHLLETTSKNLLTNSLDVMEHIGKKTFDVFTEPTTENKERRKIRFQAEQPNLSNVLKEAAVRPPIDYQTESSAKSPDNASMTSFDALFERHNGAVYMDALKMFSSSQKSQLKFLLNALSIDKREAFMKKLDFINRDYEQELNFEHISDDMNIDSVEAAWNSLSITFYNCDKVLGCLRRHLEFLEELTPEPKIIFESALTFFAETCANAVECFLKTGQLLAVEKFPIEPRKLAKFTTTLNEQINVLACRFSLEIKATLLTLEDSRIDEANFYLTEVFLQAGHCCEYIKEASEQILPILQLIQFERWFGS